jgi:GNAT superfamily N-acetyltransferase
MENIIIKFADTSDLVFVDNVKDAILIASEQKGTGIAVRSAEYIRIKIMEGKAIMAKTDSGTWAGFCYIESWGHNRFVANSGLIVDEKYRGKGLAKAIKSKAFELSQKLFPGAKLFGLTTSLAVMKINSELGYKPVTISELTNDEEFWKGCQTCPYYDILVRTKRSHCLCTAMLLDPADQKTINHITGKAISKSVLTQD